MTKLWDENRMGKDGESRKSYKAKIESGFFDKYLGGEHILDIGYDGNFGGPTICEGAIGVDKDYPGYDGIHLPFEDSSQDTVYASHCLEHITDYKAALKEWFRVLKVGGFLVVVVPHYQLYEKRFTLPSIYNFDHKRMYHAGVLTQEIHDSLPFGEWRLRHCIDNDANFTYDYPCNKHSDGCYEVEAVVEKIPHHAYIDEMLNGP